MVSAALFFTAVTLHRCCLFLILCSLIATAALAASSATPQPQLVIHKEGTGEYHRPWCPVIRDGKDVLALTRGQAEARGLKSHPACEKDPATEAATGTAGAGSSARKPASPVFVYVDGSKYYHREKCAAAHGSLTRVSLDTAGKTQWPCPTCRPPVRRKADAPAVPKRGTRE